MLKLRSSVQQILWIRPYSVHLRCSWGRPYSRFPGSDSTVYIYFEVKSSVQQIPWIRPYSVHLRWSWCRPYSRYPGSDSTVYTYVEVEVVSTVDTLDQTVQCTLMLKLRSSVQQIPWIRQYSVHLRWSWGRPYSRFPGSDSTVYIYLEVKSSVQQIPWIRPYSVHLRWSWCRPYSRYPGSDSTVYTYVEVEVVRTADTIDQTVQCTLTLKFRLSVQQIPWIRQHWPQRRNNIWRLASYTPIGLFHFDGLLR